jgi:hypothetical protein
MVAFLSRKQGPMATAKRTSPKSRPLWLKLLLGLAFAMLAALAVMRLTMQGKAEAAVAVGAHVACSCRYLADRELNQCRDDFEPGMELVMLSEDAGQQSVTAYIPLLASDTAVYSEGPGCVLQPWYR